MNVPDPSPEAPREIHVPGVRFLREQDGSPERLLKSRLLESLKQRAGVQHAYLAQISSGGQSGVALCLKTDHGPDPNLVREIGAIFAAIFGGHEHLYRASIWMGVSRQSRWQGITRPLDHAVVDCRWQALRSVL